MKVTRKYGAVLAAAALVMSAACSQDLNVANTEQPDVTRALASPSDVESLAQSLIEQWYINSTDIDPWAMLDVTADLSTANFGNFGMRFNNLEPRIPYANDAANADIEVASSGWADPYSTLGSANSVLKVLATGMILPNDNGDPDTATTQEYATIAKFAQAGALMQLGLLFDRSYIIDEKTDLSDQALANNPPQLSPYADVVKATQAKYDAVIAALKGKTWVLPIDAFPLTTKPDGVSASDLARIANTQAAMLLAYSNRDAADASKTDWAAVLKYSQNGIGTGNAGAPFDVTIQGDGGNLWYSYIDLYESRPSWMAVDQKLINMMDPCVPPKYTTHGEADPPDCPASAMFPEGHDHRLQTDSSGAARSTGVGLPHTSKADFIYAGHYLSGPNKGNVVVQGQEIRGIWMQSPYYYERYLDASYDAPGSTRFTQPLPYILAAENDLLQAEALVRTHGDKGLAATLINNTRVTRGHLTAVSAATSDDDMLKAITYERYVELFATNGFSYFYARHVGDLQAGTVHQLPIPADELELLHLPIYTFGGVGQPVENVISTGAAASSALLSRLTSGPTADLMAPNGSVVKLQLPQRPRGAREVMHH